MYVCSYSCSFCCYRCMETYQKATFIIPSNMHRPQMSSIPQKAFPQRTHACTPHILLLEHAV